MMALAFRRDSSQSASLRDDDLFIFHFACEYRNRGWATIPLENGRPGIRQWQQYQTRRPSLRTLAKWFSGSQPTYRGLGIVTGSNSGVAVITCHTAMDASR